MLHPLLQRQVNRCLGGSSAFPAELQTLLALISETYEHNEKDRRLLEHAMEVSSDEMLELNRELAEDIKRRKAAEEANQQLLTTVMESEVKFRSLFEHSSEPMMLVDESGIVLDVNKASLELINEPDKHKLLQRPFRDIAYSGIFEHRALAGKWDNHMQLAVKLGHHEFEWTCMGEGINQVQTHISATVINMMTQKRLLLRCTNLDKRNEVEVLLKQEEQRKLLIKFAESVPGAIFQLKRLENGWVEIVFLSSGIQDVFELSAAEISNNPLVIMQRVHPQDHEQLRDGFLQAAANLEVWEFSCRLQLPVRGKAWIRGSARLDRTESGEIIWNGYVNDYTEKWIADELLKESEAQFRDIFNNTDELIQNIRLSDGKFLYVNPAWSKSLGYSAEEAANLTFLDIIHPESREHCGVMFERISQGQGLDDVEATFVSKKGEKIYVRGQAGCYFKEGAPYSTRGIFQDITANRKALETIDRERALSNSIINNLPGIVYLYTEDGAMLRWNQNLEKLTQYSEDEIRSMCPDQFFNQHALPPLVIEIREQFDRSFESVELEIVTKSGELIPLLLNALPLKYEGKRCRLIMGIDISRRKLAEEQLKKNQLRLEEAQELAHIGSWEYNLRTRKLQWSKEMFKLFEFAESQKKEIAQLYRQRIHPDDLPAVDAGIQDVLVKGKTNRFEARILADHGRTRYFYFLSEPVRNLPDTEIIGLRGTVQDITERKMAEEQLLRSEERLRAKQEELIAANFELKEKASLMEANVRDLHTAHVALDKKADELALASRYKSEFLANMSHELRTPLNSIMILSKLLQKNADKSLSEKQVEFASVIQQSGADLLTLINDVLDLAKIEAGRTELVCEDVDLKQFTTGLHQTFDPIAAHKEIVFSLDIDEAVGGVMRTDQQKLSQVLSNLLSNAFKFTDPGGKVELSLQTAGQRQLLFMVTDTGIGIPADKQEIIFTAFQQADGTTQRKYGGTGLGLSISRELVKLLGGTLTLSSEPGKGSRFTVLLPECPDGASTDQ